MFHEFSESDLKQYFEYQVRSLPVNLITDDGINMEILRLSQSGRREATQTTLASLMSRYDDVFLYLEGLKESGVVNMLSRTVMHLLRQQFNTLNTSRDTLMLCWSAFLLVSEDELESYPQSRAFHRNTVLRLYPERDER